MLTEMLDGWTDGWSSGDRKRNQEGVHYPSAETRGVLNGSNKELCQTKHLIPCQIIMSNKNNLTQTFLSINLSEK